MTLDQSHWIKLARAVKHPHEDPEYTRILQLATDLQRTGGVRFPLTADRYWETWIRRRDQQRIEVAQLMAELSRYETMLNLDTLTVFEIEAALHDQPSGMATPLGIDVSGEGINHAWGMEPLSESLRIKVTTGENFDESSVSAAEEVRATFREMWQGDFEWAALSAHPQVAPMTASLLQKYHDHRSNFVAEETRRSELVRCERLDPRKAAYALAFTLHVRQIILACERLGIDASELPLDTDPIGFLQRIPTIHVLAELLAAQYQNPAARWKESDYGDMRTTCQAVVYCDVIAPDKRWAHAVAVSGLDTVYSTQIIRSKFDLIEYLEDLGRRG